MQYEGGPLALSLGDFKFFVLFIDKIGVTYLHVTLNQFYQFCRCWTFYAHV